MSIKNVIFEIIQPDHGNSRPSRIFDLAITGLIVGSVLSVYLATFELPQGVTRCIVAFDWVASVIFTVEYLLRLWTADLLYPDKRWFWARVKYVISMLAIIDLLAILPFWMPMVIPGSMLGVRALRLVRILRILKLNRYFDAIKSLGAVVRSKRRELVGSMILVVLLMLVSSLLIYTVEHDAQPTVFKNAFSGLWWAVATLTTVGYGDIYPITAAGRLIGAMIALLGVAAVAVPSGIIASGLMAQIGHEELDDEAEARETQDERHDAELMRQREKDSEHDAILKRQGEVLAELMSQVKGLRTQIQQMAQQGDNRP